MAGPLGGRVALWIKISAPVQVWAALGGEPGGRAGRVATQRGRVGIHALGGEITEFGLEGLELSAEPVDL